MSESVPFSTRLPADIAAAIEAEAARQGVSKTAAITSLIRTGQAMNAGHLLAEIQAAKTAAEAARLHAEKASTATASLSSELNTVRQELTQTRTTLAKMLNRPLAGKAAGRLGKWLGTVTLRPVKPKKPLNAAGGGQTS